MMSTSFESCRVEVVLAQLRGHSHYRTDLIRVRGRWSVGPLVCRNGWPVLGNAPEQCFESGNSMRGAVDSFDLRNVSYICS